MSNHLRVLIVSYPMNTNMIGLRWFSKILFLCPIVLAEHSLSIGRVNPYTAGIQNDAKTLKMTETLANGYSSESTQRELSNEYQRDRVWMNFINFAFLHFGGKKPQHWKGKVTGGMD